MLGRVRKISVYWAVAQSRPLFIFAIFLIGLGVLISSTSARAITNCPCHIFSTTPSSPIVATNDGPQELGVRFKPQADGYITGVRFYKDVSMTDVHSGSLWGPNGSILASGTFTNETASGWQDLTFGAPVHVTSNTVYTASYHTPVGNYIASANYFTSDAGSFPLVAPSTAHINAAGYSGNGVYISGSSAYPTNTFNSNNYWVDVDYRQTIDGSAPQVSATNPTNGATGTFTFSNLSAAFDQNLNPSTIDNSTVKLSDNLGADVATGVSYDDSTKTITLNPSSHLLENTTYTVSIRGGSGGVTNLDGTSLASDYHWTFTTGNDLCPCSAYNDVAPSGSPSSFIASGGEEFGETVHADENGYLQVIRFYKSLKGVDSTHPVHVWAKNGTLLATGTSSHESNYGWQDVRLTSPLPIVQGTKYIISYYAADTTHVFTANGLTTQLGSGVLHVDAHGSVYLNSGGDAFPNNASDPNDNMWIDAVFTTGSSYTAPFSVAVAQPTNHSFGIDVNMPIKIKLTNAVDSSTLTGAVTLKNAANQLVAGSSSYDDSDHTITYTPSSPLAASTVYTLSIANTLKDIYGTSLAPYSMDFTTGIALNTDVNQGLGGPVLVLTSSSFPYDTYLGEMLRTEGINYFTVKDISQISSSTLSNYRMVLLGASNLSSTQVSTLTTWVQSGGNLIAMRPDKKLAPLLGLSDQNQTLNDGYIKVDTTQAPGTGITAETMQYHTAADIYNSSTGTKTIATLYSDATTLYGNPAVTEKNVGSGHAAAFTYDLPKSVALTHQGNPTWAGQERDSNGPIRPDDMFDGMGGTDWLNTSKAYIPQADEQERLLVNMMLTMDKTNTPLPRFWILPHGFKSALVMTMDDHATATSTIDVFDDILNRSSTNCSVIDWTCQRSGSLLYTASGLTPIQANTANALGFAMGVHVQSSCNNFVSYADASTNYTSQIAAFRSKYSGIPSQRVDRTHCYVFSDWDTIPKVDVVNGLRINYNYEWFPTTWTGSNTGYLTGSGMSERFTDASGSMINAYQGVTDLDYENDPTSTTMDADLDNTVNSNEFYGVLGTHYDTSGSSYYKQLIDAATSRNIPMINADQLATWKDALNSSTFSNIASSQSKLTFDIQVAQGGEGMQSMIPASSGNGNLTSLKQGSSSVAYTTSTIKGVQYAVFSAAPGSYEADYGVASAAGVSDVGNTGSDHSVAKALASTNIQSVDASPAAATANVSITDKSPFVNQKSEKNPGIYSSPHAMEKSPFISWKNVGYASSAIGLGALIFWATLTLRRKPKASN